MGKEPSMSRRFRWLTVLLACVTLGCGNSGSTGPGSVASEKPIVVATIPMIADLVREVAGNDVDVRTLLNEGVDPHTYSPNGADIQLLQKADLVFINGLKLEAMESDIKKREQKDPGSVVAVAETVPTDRLRTPADYAGHPDPHIWMDVRLWTKTVPAIVAGLKSIAPTAGVRFDQRAQLLTQRLERLDNYVADVVNSIPPEKRYVVTAHDAFGYFAVAYGVEVSSVQGVSTESQAGVDDVQRIVDLIVSREIPSVFFETSVSERNVAAVLEGAKARGANVARGGNLYSDSAGPAGTWEGTYFGMIEHNVNTLARGLGGVVPEGGFRAVESAKSNTASKSVNETP